MRSIVLAAFALTAGAAAGDIRDIDGHALAALRPSGAASVLFFVMSDCPVSNAYAPGSSEHAATTDPVASRAR